MENFNQFLEKFQQIQDLTGTFSMLDVTISLVLSFILTAFIGLIYQKTHRGTSYTQSYVHTLVLMGMVVSVIMLIVGSNIARAFSLVGALSIIRFRNAVKETRDVGFIFLAMAIGMAMGTKFYVLGIITTIFISLVVLIMTKFNWYARSNETQVLKISINNDVDFEKIFDTIFDTYTKTVDLISIDSIRSGMLTQVVYSVTLKKDIKKQQMVSDIKKINDNLNVSLLTGYSTTDL